MRNLVLAAFGLFCLIPTMYGQCATMDKASPPEVLLSIVADTESVGLGQPIIVHLTFVNSSTSTFTLMDRFEVRDFEVHIRNSQGAEAPFTEYGAKIRASPYRDSTLHFISFSPGDKIAADEDLSKIYKLTFPGKYSVYGCHIINGVGSVYSNKISIVIKSP